MRRLRRFLAGGGAALLCVLVLYAAAALAMGLIGVHRGFRETPSGPSIFVVTQGVHSNIVVPAAALARVREGVLALDDLHVTSTDSLYLAIGWGDREFYLTTPTWADLRAGTAWQAASGDDATLLHVQATGALSPGVNVHELHVSPAQLQALAAAIDAAFDVDANGRLQAVAGAHYGAHDAFYVARGHYSLFFTCNEWVRGVLDQAGIRTPLWSPLPAAISWQLDEVPRESGDAPQR